MSGLCKSHVLEGGKQMLIPKPWHDGEAILTFVELETGAGGVPGAESSGEMNPNGFWKCRLNKGIHKITRDSGPVENSCENEKQMYRSPRDNRCKGLKGIFLEITLATVASLVFLDLSIWGPLDLEDPSAGNAFRLCRCHIDLFSTV